MTCALDSAKPLSFRIKSACEPLSLAEASWLMRRLGVLAAVPTLYGLTLVLRTGDQLMVEPGRGADGATRLEYLVLWKERAKTLEVELGEASEGRPRHREAA